VKSARYRTTNILLLQRAFFQTISLKGRNTLIILQTKGIYKEDGKIALKSIKVINWADITENTPPIFPEGSSIDLSISFDENIFLSGINGIVWATYDLRQSEIIQSSLIAQHIHCEVKTLKLEKENLFLISITNENETQDAIDFIWKSNDGLRLNPDWSYSPGETNKSFEQWLSGH